MKYLLIHLIIAFLAMGLSVGSEEEKDIEFIQALKTAGFLNLSVKKYLELEQKGRLKDDEKDKLYLDLFQILNERSTGAPDIDTQKILKKQAEGYFEKIKNKEGKAIKLDKAKVKLQFLGLIQQKLLKADEAEALKLKTQAKEEFTETIESLDIIRKDIAKWFEEFDLMKENDQKKLQRESVVQSEMRVNANLYFGEACVINGYIQGPSDAQARNWLITMADTYDDFLNAYFNTPAAIAGSINLGEANIMLGNYTTRWKEDRKGLELGKMQFKDALLSLSSMTTYRDWANSQMMRAYGKFIDSLMLTGDNQGALEVIDKLLAWKDPMKVDPKNDKSLHYTLMFRLDQKCKLLYILYKGGDLLSAKKISEDASRGKRITEKYDRAFVGNFNIHLRNLPDDIPLTADIAMLRADQSLREAMNSNTDAGDEVGISPSWVKSSDFYQQVIFLSAIEGKTKIEELQPKAYYYLGYCYFKLNLPLLSLASCLKALDTFPADKFNKREFEDVYEWTLKSAKLARNAALVLYKVNKGSFEEEMYTSTLDVIQNKFPDEGGDPTYFKGLMKKEGADFTAAIENFKKVEKSSGLYGMAQFHMADCGYSKLTIEESEAKKVGKEIDKSSKNYIEPREKLIAQFAEVRDSNRKKIERPKDVTEEQYAAILLNRLTTYEIAQNRLASIYRELGKYDDAIGVYRDVILENPDDTKLQVRSRDNIILSLYKGGRLDDLRKEIGEAEKIPEGKWGDWQRVDKLENYYNMVSILIVQQKIDPLRQEINSLKQQENKEVEIDKLEKQLSVVNLERADNLAKTMDATGKKDRKLLGQVMLLYYNNGDDDQKTISWMEKYFEWFPEKPELDGWHAEMLGKSKEEWDQKMGGYLQDFTSLKKTYLEFLDVLFDKQNYADMGIKEIVVLKRSSNDLPRDYSRARILLDQMDKNRKKDNIFDKNIHAKLMKIKDKIEEAENYYITRYHLAKIYKRAGRFTEAVKVFTELSKYFVEFHDIRIELAETAAASDNKDELTKARTEYIRLLEIVPGPRQQNYSPIDYYSIWLGLSQVSLKLLLMGDQPDACGVSNIWSRLRSELALDLSYFSKNISRFQKLEIEMADRREHEIFIDRFRNFFEKVLTPHIQKCNDAKFESLKEENWDEFVKSAL